MEKINLIVANGCSFTAGGGLENPYECAYFKDYLGNPNYYLKANTMNYGATNAFKHYEASGTPYWVHENDVAYPKVLEKLTGIKSINLAEQGASLQRVIRTTYRFIENYKKTLKDVLFIIEIPPGLRLEMFSKFANKFLLINSSIDNDSNIQKQPDSRMDLYTSNTIKYFHHIDSDMSEENLLKRNKFLNEYILEYFDYNEHFFEEWYLLESLLAFFEQNKINCLLTEHTYFEENYKSYHLNYNYIKKIKHIFDFTNENKLKIQDEFLDLPDGHPSLKGHELYAKLLFDNIKLL
jgi:hypothetical protein